VIGGFTRKLGAATGSDDVTVPDAFVASTTKA
jgi:hypothetical protein